MIPIMLYRLRIRRRLYSKRAPDCGKIFCKIAGEKTLIDLYGKWCAQIQQIYISLPDFLSWCLQIWRNTNSITGNIIIIAGSSTQTCTLFSLSPKWLYQRFAFPSFNLPSSLVVTSTSLLDQVSASLMLQMLKSHFELCEWETAEIFSCTVCLPYHRAWSHPHLLRSNFYWWTNFRIEGRRQLLTLWRISRRQQIAIRSQMESKVLNKCCQNALPHATSIKGNV